MVNIQLLNERVNEDQNDNEQKLSSRQETQRGLIEQNTLRNPNDIKPATREISHGYNSVQIEAEVA